MQLPAVILADGPEAARHWLDRSVPGAVEIPQPAIDELPYRDFVRALLAGPGFKLEFRGQEPETALALVSDRLFGRGAYAAERNQFAKDIAALKSFMGTLAGGPPPLVALRTYFAPGDLAWHVDRMGEPAAFRLVWPIGRPAGMRVTPADNIDQARYRAFMRREHVLLGRMDTQVGRTGQDVRSLWSHRPEQLEALISGRFPFLIDPDRHCQVRPGAASVHRVQTPAQEGTYHRSSWANHASPGVQIVISAVSGAA